MIHGKKDSLASRTGVFCQPEAITGLSDCQLLGRFRGVRDETCESAFRELIHRHGPMVMGVCRHVLRHPHDAEDAFQATFLVLMLKARSIRVAESLAPWLHRVAYRTAQRARATSLRFRQGDWKELETLETAPLDAHHVDIRRLLHEELGRLPDKYRVPIVLCHLEGKTHEEAARLLHWPVGTVSGRLSRGRELLKARLERRGVVVNPAVMLIPWLDLVQFVSISSIESALTAVTGLTAAKSVSASVISLTRGVLKTMFLDRLKTISVGIVLVGAISGGVWAHMPSQARRQVAHANLLAPTSTNEVAAAPTAISNPTRQPAVEPSSDCPLAWTEYAPPDCPVAMAANAVSRVVGYFHGDGSASSR